MLALAAVALFGVTTYAVSSHVLYGKRISGGVFDALTGNPLPGVHVAYVWESTIVPSGFTGHNSRTICSHAAAAVTDANAHFAIESWQKRSSYNVVVADPIALVYAVGYQPRQILLHEGPAQPPVERQNERYELKPFAGNVDERLDAIWGGIANRGCPYGGESQKNLFPMQKSIYEEARRIANTEDRRTRVRLFALMAAEVGIAADPNAPSDDEVVRTFVEENLR